MVLGITHLVAGVFLALVTSANLPQGILCIVGAILPDIDHPKSMLGRHTKPVGWFLKHRGVTHSIVAMIIATIGIFLLTKQQSLALYVLLGFASHLLLDAITKDGITPFYPKKLRMQGKIKVGGLLEKLFFVLLLFGILQQIL